MRCALRKSRRRLHLNLASFRVAACLNTRTSESESALHLAAMMGRTHAVELLLERGLLSACMSQDLSGLQQTAW
jgi:hypothetical protein